VFAAVESVVSSVLNKRVAVRAAFVNILKNTSRQRLRMSSTKSIGEKDKALAWQSAAAKVSSRISLSQKRLTWSSADNHDDSASDYDEGNISSEEGKNAKVGIAPGDAPQVDTLEANVNNSEAKVKNNPEVRANTNSEEAWVAVGHGNPDGKHRKRLGLGLHRLPTMERVEALVASHIDRVSLVVFPVVYAVYTTIIFG
jgi:hypothetical protein